MQIAAAHTSANAAETAGVFLNNADTISDFFSEAKEASYPQKFISWGKYGKISMSQCLSG